jgi:site-specific DNA recombinase
MTTTSPPTKAVIYFRVSTTRQATEGNGLDSQETRCRMFAEANRLEVIAAFHDDASGSLIKRPAMTDMLKFLSPQKEPIVVIIDDISRLARSIETHITLRAKLAGVGAVLASPSIKFGQDSDSQFFEHLMAIVAEHGRNKNGEQVKARMLARMMNGYWTFNCPTGYEFKKLPEHGKILVKQEPHASTVKEVYEGFAAGRFTSIIEVLRFLKNHPTWPTRLRKAITSESVKDLLTRPHYAGVIHYPNWGLTYIKGKHEPIVSFEVFQAVQDKLKARAQAPARINISENFALRGFVDCGCCGKPMSSCLSKGRYDYYPYYLCHIKACEAYGKSVRKEVIEGEFEELLQTLHPTKPLFDLAAEVFKDVWNSRVRQAKSHLQHFETELKKLDEKAETFLERVVQADSEILIKTYEDKIKSIEAEKVILREKIANHGRPQRSFDDTFRTAMEFLQNPYRLWVSGLFSDKRAVLKLAFAGNLSYVRNEGFRTVNLATPFKFIKDLVGKTIENKKMVEPRGVEPLTS